MRTHEQVDRRSMALAIAVARRIDADPLRTGFAKARETCARWYKREQSPACREWLELLDQPWQQARSALLDGSERGRRLRQSNPFCGVLSPRERWSIYREFTTNEAL